ncbi:MAG: AMP-binding protein [Alphaproteobacteria bacterium]|jgi:phenylacetate-CoA ligase|nr:AMP-binding protein [Alphaproteobacteria bacterium]
MATRDEHYDELEQRDSETRRREQFARLRQQIAHAKAKAAYFTKLFAEVEVEAIDGPEALARLPVTRKPDLARAQKADPPFGGLATQSFEEMSNVFMSPGPLYEPGGDDKDYGRFSRALWAAGVRPGDLVYNTFSYHLTPAAMLVELGAQALRCPVFPGGVGNTDLQVQAIAELRPRVYCGTPSFLKILVERGDEAGLDTSSLAKGLVGAEPLFPAVRQMLSERGIEVSNSYGTADIGLIAYETSAQEGMVVDEGIILELVEPGGSQPVAEGEIGEVVVSTFNPTYPLVRYGTGDLSAVLPGASPCGRTNMRIKGWMGRADQSVKVRGMFVHPSNVADLLRRHPEVSKARLVVDSVDSADRMTLKVAGAGEDAAEAIVASIQSVLKLRGEVELVDAEALPDDGKVIDDIRKFD